jgi:hypothetical protein
MASGRGNESSSRHSVFVGKGNRTESGTARRGTCS